MTFFYCHGNRWMDGPTIYCTVYFFSFDCTVRWAVLRGCKWAWKGGWRGLFIVCLAVLWQEGRSCCGTWLFCCESCGASFKRHPGWEEKSSGRSLEGTRCSGRWHWRCCRPPAQTGFCRWGGPAASYTGGCWSQGGPVCSSKAAGWWCWTPSWSPETTFAHVCSSLLETMWSFTSLWKHFIMMGVSATGR